MACGCETYQCRQIFVNPCIESVNTKILATIDGQIEGVIEFNGAWTNFNTSVTLGQNIYLPVELFNENYTHEVRITQGDEEICYQLITNLTLNNTSPIIDNSMWNWARITGIAPATMVVEDSRLTGDVSPEIWINGEGYDYLGSGITKVTTGLDFSAIGGFPGGVLSFQYKNLPI